MHWITKILSAFIVAMCLVMAGFFAFSELMIDHLFGTRRYILIAVLLFYAVFRGIRLYLSFSKRDTDEE
jgi:hypothetical protein